MRVLLAAVFLVVAATTHATTAFKCVDAKGNVAFQDHPCTSGAKQSRLYLTDEAPTPPPPAASTDDVANDATPTAPSIPSPPSLPAVPPPNFFLCVRYDGSRYMSETGQGGSALVPLGVMGVPGRSLADAYGGPNGIGVSAPGLRTIPSVPAASVPFGGMDTWVDDVCHRASPREACAYLRQQRDDVISKLRRAFSDTEADLRRQQADIDQRLRGC
jgi:hypothetical protein